MFDAIKDRIEFIRLTMENIDIFAFHDYDAEDYEEPISAPSDTNVPVYEQTVCDKS